MVKTVNMKNCLARSQRYIWEGQEKTVRRRERETLNRLKERKYYNSHTLMSLNLNTHFPSFFLFFFLPFFFVL